MSKLRVNEIEPVSGPQVSVGAPATLDGSILFNLQSTTQGFAPPRMTTAQRNAITSPAEGLLVFNTDSHRLEEYANGQWTVAGNGQQPVQNVLRVLKNPVLNAGDFSSVAAALASITTNSPTNQFVIEIGPGVYTEPQLVMKPYVSVVGTTKLEVVLTPTVPNQNFIIGCDTSSLEYCTIAGITGVGNAALYLSNGTFQVNNCSFVNNSICVWSDGVTNTPILTINNCTFSGAFGNAIIVKNNGNPAEASVKNCLIDASASTGDSILVSGVGTELLTGSVSCRANFGGHAGVRLSDGAFIQCSGLVLADYSIGFIVPTGGSNPRVALVGTTFVDCTNDLQILHPGTFGTINATAEGEKSTFDPATVNNLAILLADPDGDIEISGELKQRQPDGSFTDITTLSSFSSAMGIIGNGDINPPAIGFPFTVTVESGFGYLQNSDGSIKKITWPDTPITIPANSIRYLYFDNTSTLQQGASLPDVTQNIVIGRIVTNSTGVLIVEESGFLSTHASSKIGTALRNGLGAIYASGSTTSESGTRQLAVTSGEYYYGERQFLANGGNPITFTEFYRDGVGGFTSVLAQTTIDNANYDSGTGTLTPLTAGYYAKHSLYALGDSTNDFDSEAYFVVYSQQQYSALTLAEQGSLPNPPAFLSEAVTLIASIIVQQGTTHIVEILDERPLFSAKRVATVAATTFHHNLQGLNDFDDHLRYLPVDGSRPMTGDLPMGTHNVTNAGTYNGVTVENHHARHQPGGADAIPTAAASTQTPNQANAEGVSTSLARADHVHNVPTAAPATQGPDNANADGVATTFSKADHVHNIPTAAPAQQLADQVAAKGTSTSFARADHIHNIPTAAPSTLNPNIANTQGTSTSFAKADHIHNVPTAAPANQTIAAAAADGSATTFSKSDHIHTFSTAVPTDIGSANAAGTSTSFVHADHVHKGVHSVKAGLAGTQRFGDLSIDPGNGVSVTDDGSGNFTIDTIGGPNELVVTASSGLTANYTAGKVRYNGTFTQVSSGSIVLSANITNGRVYVDTSGAVQQTASNTEAPPYTTVLAIFTTGPSTITSLTDRRTFINQNLVFALIADISTITPDASASIGTSNRLAMADHVHAIATAAAVSQTPDQSNAKGTSTSFARADHVHNIPTAAASTISTNANGQGSAATFARADHIHQLTQTIASQDHIPQFDGSNWQATYIEAAWAPARSYRLFDDFISGSSAGALGWVATLTGGGSVVTISNTGVDSGHPGVVVITAGNAAGRFSDLNLGLNTMELGGGAIVIECLFQLQTLTNAAFRIGLGDQAAADHNNGVYLEYNSAVSANWLIKTANGATRTSTTTTVAATSGVWHKLVISINAAATSVSYTLDGTSLGTITTNIPTTNPVSPNLQADSVGATATTFWVDYFNMYQRFTTSR